MAPLGKHHTIVTIDYEQVADEAASPHVRLVAPRDVIPAYMWESAERDGSWMLRAHDIEADRPKDFAMSRIHGWRERRVSVETFEAMQREAKENRSE